MAEGVALGVSDLNTVLHLLFRPLENENICPVKSIPFREIVLQKMEWEACFLQTEQPSCLQSIKSCVVPTHCVLSTRFRPMKHPHQPRLQQLKPQRHVFFQKPPPSSFYCWAHLAVGQKTMYPTWLALASGNIDPNPAVRFLVVSS